MRRHLALAGSALLMALAACSDSDQFVRDEERFRQSMEEVYPGNDDYSFFVSTAEVFCESDGKERAVIVNGLINAGSSVDDAEEFVKNVSRYMCAE